MAGQREQAKRAVMADIRAEGRRQLARDGASGLSVRSVARELDMASSAIYRHVASRDELLTLLIIDGYERLGTTLEKAGADLSGRAQWLARCDALRAWAHAHLQEYALLYGSPVPGYAAPQDTIGPAGRVYAVLAAPVRDRAPDLPEVEGPLAVDGAGINEALGISGPPAAGLALLQAWSGLFGIVSLELFGHTHNVVTDHDAYFHHHVAALADDLGL